MRAIAGGCEGAPPALQRGDVTLLICGRVIWLTGGTLERATRAFEACLEDDEPPEVAILFEAFPNWWRLCRGEYGRLEEKRLRGVLCNEHVELFVDLCSSTLTLLPGLQGFEDEEKEVLRTAVGELLSQLTEVTDGSDR